MIDPTAFIHDKALVDNGAVIGANTRIWGFTHILAGARIGADCNICEQVFVENDVVVGDRVTVKCGVQLWDGLRLEDDVFVGPNATFTNDKLPRSKQYPESFPQTTVKHGASIGANATILPGLTIGAESMVGAGAVVTTDVPPKAIVIGNPARIMGYVDTVRRPPAESATPSLAKVGQVKGVTLHDLKHVSDMRGDLIVTELEKDLPFVPKRMFFVHDVPSARVRGEHAHRECHQFLVCLKGTVSVVADDGEHSEEFELNCPWLGLHLPPRVWGIQYKYSPDAVLMVYASHSYDPNDYIRDYDDFIREVRHA